MNSYRIIFKKYLDELSQRKPAPGGGSALCLVFCLGVSLIQKSIGFSIRKTETSRKVRANNKKLTNTVDSLGALRNRIYPYIDRDGLMFDKIIKTRGKRRDIFIEESQKMMVDTARACNQVFGLAKGVETGIKNNIVSDFNIGLRCVGASLYGCFLNLEANNKMFGKKSRYQAVVKNYLKKWQKFLK